MDKEYIDDGIKISYLKLIEHIEITHPRKDGKF